MKTLLTISFFCLLSFLSNAQTVSTYAGNNSAGYFGDGGLATNAKLNYPLDVTTNENGDLFIVDNLNSRIRWVDHNTGYIETLTESDDMGNTIAPLAITYNNGFIYFLDTLNGSYRIMKYDINNGTGNSSVLYNFLTSFDYRGIEFLNGKLYLINTISLTIDVISDLNTMPVLSNTFVVGGANSNLGGLTADQNGDIIFSDEAAIKKINVLNGNVTTIVSSVYLDNPTGIDIASDGTIYCSDIGNEQIFKIDVNGGLTVFSNQNSISGYYNGPVADAEYAAPFGLTIDSNDDIYIADANNNVIRLITCSPATSPVVELSSYSTEDCPDELYFYIPNQNSYLEENTDWSWYLNACGSSIIGTGDTLYFNPKISQSYFVRGEGGCIRNGDCTETSFDAINCSDTSDIISPLIPTAFSPNKDGVNDVWVIDSLKPNTTLQMQTIMW